MATTHETIGGVVLYLGDCREVLPSLAGMEADMIFADPPYGMRKKNICNDSQAPAALLDFNKTWIPMSFDVLRDGGSWYCFGTESSLLGIYTEILNPKIQEQKLTYRNWITWDKENSRAQRTKSLKQYPTTHEDLFFGTKGRRTVKRGGCVAGFVEEYADVGEFVISELRKAGIGNDEYQSITGLKYKYGHLMSRSSWNQLPESQYKKIAEYCRRRGIKAFERPYQALKDEYDKANEAWQRGRTFFDNTHEKMGSVWRDAVVFPWTKEYVATPAQKPLSLCRRVVKTSCPPGGTVVDPFMCSASAGVACMELGRRYVGIEIIPEYFDIACKRIADAAKK